MGKKVVAGAAYVNVGACGKTAVAVAARPKQNSLRAKRGGSALGLAWGLVLSGVILLSILLLPLLLFTLPVMSYASFALYRRSFPLEQQGDRHRDTGARLG